MTSFSQKTKDQAYIEFKKKAKKQTVPWKIIDTVVWINIIGSYLLVLKYVVAAVALVWVYQYNR
jgi:hypothetical protein